MKAGGECERGRASCIVCIDDGCLGWNLGQE